MRPPRALQSSGRQSQGSQRWSQTSKLRMRSWFKKRRLHVARPMSTRCVPTQHHWGGAHSFRDEGHAPRLCFFLKQRCPPLPWCVGMRILTSCHPTSTPAVLYNRPRPKSKRRTEATKSNNLHLRSIRSWPSSPQWCAATPNSLKNRVFWIMMMTCTRFQMHHAAFAHRATPFEGCNVRVFDVDATNTTSPQRAHHSGGDGVVLARLPGLAGRN
jgi:hypothetical protein